MSLLNAASCVGIPRILSRAAAKRTTRAVDTQAAHVAHFTAKLCVLRCPVVQTCLGGTVVSVKRKVMWTVIHVLAFFVAVVIFYFGLGVGLAFNPLLGTLLWILALAVAGLNLYVMLRRFARRWSEQPGCT